MEAAENYPQAFDADDALAADAADAAEDVNDACDVFVWQSHMKTDRLPRVKTF